MSLNITPIPPTVSAFGTGAATSTGTIVLAAGNNITLNTGASSITIVGPAAGAPPAISYIENVNSALIGTIAFKSQTITGALGFGSSLFLHRLMIPGPMTVTEAFAAMALSFNTTSDGAGTISRSLGIYSFGNSSSLASVTSVSGSSAWTTGTSTAGAATSLTQYQGGWSGNCIHPMTFGSFSLAAGEYVVGNLFNFAQLSSSWTLSLFGARAVVTGATFFNTATSIAFTTAGAVSIATIAGSGITGVSSYASQFLALSTAGSLSAFTFQGTVSTGTSSQVLSVSTLQVTVTNSAKSCSFQLVGNQANSNLISSIGVNAGSVINGLTTIGAMTSASIVTALLNNAQTNIVANFRFIGTSSTTAQFPDVFVVGQMSTGALPTAITLTSAAVSFQPTLGQLWFALAGS